jgi:hypothetical protein
MTTVLANDWGCGNREGTLAIPEGLEDKWNGSERLDNLAVAGFIDPVMPIDLLNVPTEQLQRILEIRQQIDALRNGLNQVQGVGPAPASSTTPAKPGRKKGKRYFSPEARQKSFFDVCSGYQ